MGVTRLRWWRFWLTDGDTQRMSGTDDWVQDSSLSREETLRRFRALGPEPTIGPSSSRPVLVLVWDGTRAVAPSPTGQNATVATPTERRTGGVKPSAVVGESVQAASAS